MGSDAARERYELLKARYVAVCKAELERDPSRMAHEAGRPIDELAAVWAECMLSAVERRGGTGWLSQAKDARKARNPQLTIASREVGVTTDEELVRIVRKGRIQA